MSSFFSTQADIDQFDRDHRPCGPDSPYHDLACNHRVREEYPGHCGTNCKRPQNSHCALSFFFVCPTCVTKAVREHIFHVIAECGKQVLTFEEMLKWYGPQILQEKLDEGGKVVCSAVVKEESGIFQELNWMCEQANKEDELALKTKLAAQRQRTRAQTLSSTGTGTRRKTPMDARRSRTEKEREKWNRDLMHGFAHLIRPRGSTSVSQPARTLRSSKVDDFKKDKEKTNEAPGDSILKKVQGSRVTRRKTTRKTTSAALAPVAEEQPVVAPAEVPEDPVVKAMRELLEKVMLRESIVDHEVKKVAEGVEKMHMDEEVFDVEEDSELSEEEHESDEEDDSEDESEDAGVYEDPNDLDYDPAMDSDEDFDLDKLEHDYDLRYPNGVCLDQEAAQEPNSATPVSPIHDLRSTRRVGQLQQESTETGDESGDGDALSVALETEIHRVHNLRSRPVFDRSSIEEENAEDDEEW